MYRHFTMAIESRYSATVLALIFTFMQIHSGLAQSLAPPLPIASQYTIKNWLGVKQLGPQLPFAEDKVCIFADKITLEDLHFQRNGGTAKHILLIADSVIIGSSVSIDSHSDTSSQDARDGGSFVILCRRLRFRPDSHLFINGATSSPETMRTEGIFTLPNLFGPSPPLPLYKGGFGCQILISTETLDLNADMRQAVAASQTKRAAEVFGQELGRPSTFSEVTKLGQEWLNGCRPWLTQQDIGRLSNTFSGQLVTQDMIDSALQLMQLMIDHLTDKTLLPFVTVDNRERAKYSSSVDPDTPFRMVRPLWNFQSTHDYPSPLTVGTSVEISAIHEGYFHGDGINGPIDFWIEVRREGHERLGSTTGSDALRTLSAKHQTLFSQWALEWMRYQQTLANHAHALMDKPQLFNVLRRVVVMPVYQLDAPYAQQYDAINLQVLALLSEAQNLVSEHPIVLDAPYSGTVVTLHARGIPAKYYLPPTDLLLSGIRNGRVWNHGILQTVADPSGTILKLSMQAELQTDPRMQKAVADKLRSEDNASLEPGLLPNIQYEIQGVTGDGIRKFGALVTGSYVSFDIQIDNVASQNVMFRLATSGLPFYLKWSVPGDPQQGGTLGPFPLRLNRRLGGRLSIEGMLVKNDELTSSAKVSYVRTSTGRYLSLPSTLVVPPGDTVALGNLSLEAGERVVNVPDTAVEYDDGSFSDTLSRFLVLEPGSLVADLVIDNKIPAVATAPGTQLMYQVRNVDLVVSRLEAGSNQAVEIARCALSPAGSQGSVFRLPIIRLPASPNRYLVSGSVLFADGGSTILKTKEADATDLSLTLDDIVFPQNN